MKTATWPRTTASRGMHPMFAELFMSPGDDDDPFAGGRRRARRAKRLRTRARASASAPGQRG